MHHKSYSTIGMAIALLVTGAGFTVELDKNLPIYTKSQGVGGNLDSIGSDTLNNLMTYWAESFRELYPNVHVQIEGKGSSTAPPALISGTAHLGPMSRKMKSTEEDAFEKKYGFKPMAIGVALDSLAVYVNKDNSMTEISFPEIDAVFSKTRKGGYDSDIKTWGELGLENSLAPRPISLYGRNSASGTYAFFKANALFKGDYKDTVKEQPGSASVVMGVAEDMAGIGYSGIGYKTSGVKVLAVSEESGEIAYAPTYENVLSGKYPLGRMLYVYVVKKPGESLPAVTEEFLRFVLSKAGQEIVVKDGYLPLPAKVVERQLAQLK